MTSLARYVNGEDRAFNEVVGTHRRLVRSLIRRFARFAHDERDDIEQAVWMKLHRARASLDIERIGCEGQVRALLFIVVRNVCWQILRKDTRNAPRRLDWLFDPARLRSQPSIESEVIEAEQTSLHREVLECMLQKLPPVQRVAITEYVYHGRSMLDIAASLGCSPASLRVAAHRGRERLRRELAGWNEH